MVTSGGLSLSLIVFHCWGSFISIVKGYELAWAFLIVNYSFSIGIVKEIDVTFETGSWEVLALIVDPVRICLSCSHKRKKKRKASGKGIIGSPLSKNLEMFDILFFLTSG